MIREGAVSRACFPELVVCNSSAYSMENLDWEQEFGLT